MRKLPLSITLTPYQKEVLDAAAASEDRSLSWIIGAAIEHFATTGGPFNGNDFDPVVDRETMKAIMERHYPKGQAV